MAQPQRLPVESNRKTAGQELETAAREGLLFITKAFRGGIDLGERENRALLTTASSVVGNWAKYRQSTSAMEQTQFAMATMLAKDGGGKVIDMMKLTMPAHRVTKALGPGTETVVSGDDDGE